MSSRYRALLQGLDETESEVTRGLGRSIKIKKKRTGCCGCCCERWFMWTCMSAAILTGLALSVAVPIMLTVPVDSPWHWKQWTQRLMLHIRPAHNTSNAANNGTLTMEEANEADGDPSTPEVSDNSTAVFHQVFVKLHRMGEWMTETYEQTPKVPLIIALCVLLMAILTVIWMVVYRKIRRRQRRRLLGKLVTDLQSGKTLLNSDDSEED